MKKFFYFLPIFLLATVSCAKAEQTASAHLHGTADQALSGTVHFIAKDNGVQVVAHVEGLPQGNHGFHIHEIGDCSDSGKAAGGHFNPDKHDHGDAVKNGLTQAHAGDLGNLEVGADGKGSKEVFVPGLTLSEGPHGITGRSVIVHEKEDDFSQPTGNAGGRIGCGVIQTEV